MLLWLTNIGFGGSDAPAVSIWSAATTNTSLWYAQNPTETTWDAGATYWDLDGNVYQTLWDNIDDTWADTTPTATTWTDV